MAALSVSRTWIQSFVEEVWQIPLQPFQLEDLQTVVGGGIYALMYPTDFGKSMLLEMGPCIRLVQDPNRRQLGVKINDAAASEWATEIARRLEFISTELKDHGGPAYPQLKPVVRWTNGVPFGIGKGFDVVGRKDVGRNINRSVRGYGLGARDLQGKRGDTWMDDIERQEEARSEAYRTQLEVRVSAVFRTMEDKQDMLWVAAGTPTHEESIYYQLTEKLKGIGLPYKEIWRPFRNDDGSLLWEERARKIEAHRRVMSKAEWASAYELRPVAGRKMTAEEVRELVRDPHMPWIGNEKDLVSWLRQWANDHRPPNRDPLRWQFEVAEKLSSLAIYIGWDPATSGDWAVSCYCIWGRNVFILRSQLQTGDTWRQVMTVKEMFLDFPSAEVVLENNGQQRAFKDVAEEDEVLQFVTIRTPHTSGNIKDPDVGVPAMMARIQEGWFSCPWGDVERAEEEYQDLEVELTRYGPTSHPHILPSIWFGWAYHRRHDVTSSARRRMEEEAIEERLGTVKIDFSQLRPPVQLGSPQATVLHSRAQSAWKRRHAR